MATYLPQTYTKQIIYILVSVMLSVHGEVTLDHSKEWNMTVTDKTN